MIEFIAPLLLVLDVMHKPACSAEKVQEILAPASVELIPPHFIIDPDAPGASVLIDCSVKLPSSAVISKLVRFRGSASSNVVFDCNGATIDPLGDLKISRAAIDVEPRRMNGGGQNIYEPVHDLTVKNCDVKGSVRISSSYYTPDDRDFIPYKNQSGPDYVQEIRATSPTNIVLDNLSIRNSWREDTVYFEQGVTFSKLINSRVNHGVDGVALYLGPESGFNTIENNEFHSDSHNRREIIAVDGSEGNLIARNWFSGLDHGGIFLYRNCGESGQVRYLGPWLNDIRDNVFYYNNAIDPEPAVWVGSKNGDSGTFLPWGWQCDTEDDHAPTWTIANVDPSWGWDNDWEASSTVDYDYARHNLINKNRVCNRSTSGMFKVTNASFNFGNLVSNNDRIDCPSPSPFPR